MSSASSSSSVSSAVTSTLRIKKQLRFGSVEIRDVPMQLGEHPPSSGGAPVTLGWEVYDVRQLPVDVYEVMKSGEPVRTEDELMMDVTERAEILLEAGYSLDEIVQASENASELLKQRESSLASQKNEFWHVAREAAKRKVSKAFSSSRKNRAVPAAA